jgi:TolB protein
MKRAAMIFLVCSISLTGLACSESSLGLGEEIPPADTPPVGTPPEETPGLPVNAQLAFVSTRDGSPHIYLAREDGSHVTRLAAGERPAWSWEGLRIAFQRGGVIYVINADGSNERRLVGGLNPAWSPDDGRIVFDRSEGIFVLDLATPRTTRLISSEFVSAEAPEGGDPWVGQPAWSPNGRKIAFVRGSFDDSWRIYIMNADGSEPRVLSHGPAEAEPAWSPDGFSIAFESTFGVGRVSADGSEMRVFVRGFNPDWSADGSSIVFSRFMMPDPFGSPVGSRERIVVVGEDGVVRQLIPDAVAPALPDYRDYDPAWSR